jgi:hypothetical protein
METQMKTYIDKCECCIHSPDGGLAEATILKRIGDNQYLAQYGDVKCHAIFNPFSGRYYLNDLYGVVRKPKERGPERTCPPFPGKEEIRWRRESGSSTT